jgi:DNA-binding MarR family transcriptional regulator
MSIGFLTSHAHVLASVAQDPEVRMRDVAARVGLTERAVQRIVRDLEQGGYLRRVRRGRRNLYEVRGGAQLAHPLERHRRASAVLALALGEERDDTPAIAARNVGVVRNRSFID